MHDGTGTASRAQGMQVTASVRWFPAQQGWKGRARLALSFLSSISVLPRPLPLSHPGAGWAPLGCRERQIANTAFPGQLEADLQRNSSSAQGLFPDGRSKDKGGLGALSSLPP